MCTYKITSLGWQEETGAWLPWLQHLDDQELQQAASKLRVAAYLEDQMSPTTSTLSSASGYMSIVSALLE